MCAAFTWAKNFGCKAAALSFVNAHNICAIRRYLIAYRANGRAAISKQESDQFCRDVYGAVTKIGVSPDPRSGDDAAADAGHQAAATLQSRPGCLCGR